MVPPGPHRGAARPAPVSTLPTSWDLGLAETRTGYCSLTSGVSFLLGQGSEELWSQGGRARSWIQGREATALGLALGKVHQPRCSQQTPQPLPALHMGVEDPKEGIACLPLTRPYQWLTEIKGISDVHTDGEGGERERQGEGRGHS